MSYWIVTGGASGIGGQLVRDLVVQGHDVLVWDIKEPAARENVTFRQVDLTDMDAIAKAADEVSKPVDCLVHCAGVMVGTSIRHANLVATMQLTFQIHCLAFVAAVQALLDKFAPKASVIAITSAGMEVVYPATLAYGASKAALERAIFQLAVELADRGIRVNGIAPGAISTEMTRHMWADPAYATARLKHIPAGRQAETSAVTGVITFLASDAAAYVTGEVMWVDGGVRHGIFLPTVREFVESAEKKP
jgi:NAD(P)-dependent dehydrogenase (short-subunit alcohol dehydrogenase family)